MMKFRPDTGSQGRLLAGRRAQILAAGLALLLTSGFAAQANAAAKPAYNHFIKFTPTSPAPASYLAGAELFDGNGKVIYTWKKNSKGNKIIKRGFYSVDAKAYVKVTITIHSNGGAQDFKSKPEPSTCNHGVIVTATNTKHSVNNCK